MVSSFTPKAALPTGLWLKRHIEGSVNSSSNSRFPYSGLKVSTVDLIAARVAGGVKVGVGGNQISVAVGVAVGGRGVAVGSGGRGVGGAQPTNEKIMSIRNAAG
jgi:hypothetical protein